MHVGVIGAGISGLIVTHELRKHGVDVTTFEARERPGGIVQSRIVDGHVLELGPQRLRLVPSLSSLINELGLDNELRRGHEDYPLFIHHDDDLHVVPLSLREVITTDLISFQGKVRALKEPFTPPQQPNESVDTFLTRKFGAEIARRWLGPLYSGLYGTDTDEMLMRYSLGRALNKADINGSILLSGLQKVLKGRNTPPVYTLDSGLGTLTKQLYQVNSDTIELDTPVKSVQRQNGDYIINTSTHETAVDELVITTPANQASTFLRPCDSQLADLLQQFNYNTIGMVFLKSPFDGEGIGTLVPSDSSVSISGLTWNHSFLDRDRLFTAYVDTNSFPRMADASDKELGEVAATAFTDITGAPASPITVHRWSPGMPAYDTSWTALDEISLPSNLHFCASFTDRPGIIGRVRNASRLADILADKQN
ncbi:protoporphyrinogen oxidase [Salinarchaeum sp. IM2453]|uniref:protoporphyrinogen oxidase n=1 Tax=Salinarchaeum sp. IM2453 TaxID=2862870 RepID=UPI001C8357C4|nr:protoporphyrinogen oxidase [Salinarchaeum sp. IM2453]QZA88131.1 protoporphyrinogen oxidase [Salinarchaeum sp. IM2453]